MNQDNVKLMQSVQLEIFEAFHDICEKNSIRYYMVGGTLLGAVRHKGFIPWDADIDIAMPRKDYDKFIEEYSSFLEPKYSVLTHNNYQNFQKPHALIVKNGTVLKTDYDLLNPDYSCPGIYIELFPLDNVPRNINKQKKQDKRIILLQRVIYRKASIIFKSDSIFRVFIKRFIRFLFMPVSFKFLGEKLQGTMRLYNTKNEYTGLLCSMAGKHGYKKETLPESYYGLPIKLNFEDKMFYAPVEYKLFLEHYYGDYMTIPPLEEQEKMYNYFSEVKMSSDSSD